MADASAATRLKAAVCIALDEPKSSPRRTTLIRANRFLLRPGREAHTSALPKFARACGRRGK
jgi:hypothetical protein